VLAYVLNRLWTFDAAGGVATALQFTVLYTCTLVLNVAVNAGVLGLLGDAPLRVETAFLAAQAVSTTINFLVMRQVVFARPRRPSS
jgi:putative flippase GtrA